MSQIKEKTYEVYMMPGMAANPLIFERIILPKNFKINYLEWLMPSDNEEFDNYISRISKLIKGKNIVLIGVSFGGIIVQEIAKIISVHKVIIISSVKTSKELPFLMQLGKNIGAHKFFPVNWLQSFESLAQFALGPSINKKIELYRKYLSVRDKKYLRWSIDKITGWNNDKYPDNLIHIHGTHDLVFPSIYIKDAIFVKKATHAMILVNAKWFNDNLPDLICKN